MLKPTVLIVDDEKPTREGLRAALEDRYDVYLAEDGEGEVVARVVAVPTEDPEIEEIGYITCTHRQGEGIAHECTTALLAHLLDEEGKREITAEVDAENTASIRLLDRLGFQRSALHLAFEETHKGVCDVAIYTLSRERWAEREG